MQYCFFLNIVLVALCFRGFDQDLGGSPTLFGVAAIINHMSELLAYFMCSRLLTAFGE